MKQPILAHAISKPVHSIRLEIQSLRAIAILSVLAFHLWGRSFKHGYLGVDMFFVISGYLMCMLMFRQTKFNANTILDFYFRRFKRILPTYLLLMNIVLLLVICFGSQFDYPFILREIAPSAFFYSNSPSAHMLSYFDEDSKYSIFLHTWSLATEVQFYVIFPLFFVCIIALTHVHPSLKFLFISAVITYSFIFQTFSTGDSSHMLLTARLWQFFFGFVAHFVHETEWIQTRLKTQFKIFNYKSNINFCAILLNGALVLLLSLLCFDFSIFQQLNRLLISILTAFLIALPFHGGGLLLKSPVLVELGDISYSVYLIHWPLFVAHRMLFGNLYTLNKDPDLSVGLMLSALAITFGYVSEKSVNYVFKHVKTWIVLILFVLVAYLCLGATSYFLFKHSPKVFESDVESERANYNEIVQIWENRYNYTELTPAEAFELNQKMTSFVPTRGYVLSLCANQTREVPSNYAMDLNLIHSVCHEQGTGNKTVVVFGNSHAIFSHAGIAHLFEDVYSDLWTIFQFSCVPLPEKQQQARLSPSGKRDCVLLMDEIIKALREWNKPIDILVVLFGYNGMDDSAINVNLEARNEGFLYMQHFFDLLENKTVSHIGDSRSKVESFMPVSRRHLEMLQCKRCIRVNWSNLWCEPEPNGLCRAVDKNGLLYFVDEHHTSLYGSLFVGEYLRRLYSVYLTQSAIN